MRNLVMVIGSSPIQLELIINAFPIDNYFKNLYLALSLLMHLQLVGFYPNPLELKGGVGFEDLTSLLTCR